MNMELETHIQSAKVFDRAWLRQAFSAMQDRVARVEAENRSILKALAEQHETILKKSEEKERFTRRFATALEILELLPNSASNCTVENYEKERDNLRIVLSLEKKTHDCEAHRIDYPGNSTYPKQSWCRKCYDVLPIPQGQQ